MADSIRKYEYTFLSRANKLAVSYTHKREDLSDEKIGCLINNDSGISVFFITKNDWNGINEQYPEWTMKIQKQQGYCALLTSNDSEYEAAKLNIVFYDIDIEG